MSKVKVGIIGTGGVCYDHGRQLSALEEADTVAITEPNEANGKRRDIFGLTDAVVICSPHTLHFQQTMEALSSGRHVLVQKPMTCSSEESEQLITAANKAGKCFRSM